MNFKSFLKEDATYITLKDRVTLRKLYSNERITPDTIINVDGMVDFSLLPSEYSKLPYIFNFVSGNFDCSNSKLTTLKGAPKQVGGDFFCSNNLLDSLEYSPKIIHGKFSCTLNNIKNFEGLDSLYIGKGIYLAGNNIESLVGVNKHFKEINGIFSLGSNNIESGGLGMLLIKGLHEISSSHNAESEFKKSTKIINKYLLDGSSNIKGIKALYLCEDELIQAGLETYTKM